MEERHLVRTVRLAVLLGVLVALAGCGEDQGLKVNRLSSQKGVGGDIVTIHGSGFQSGGVKDVRVFFDHHQAKVRRIKGNTEIQIEVPGGVELGKTVDLRVIFEPGGEITYPKAFTYSEPTRNTLDDLVGDEQKAGSK